MVMQGAFNPQNTDRYCGGALRNFVPDYPMLIKSVLRRYHWSQQVEFDSQQISTLSKTWAISSVRPIRLVARIENFQFSEDGSKPSWVTVGSQCSPVSADARRDKTQRKHYLKIFVSYVEFCGRYWLSHRPKRIMRVRFPSWIMGFTWAYVSTERLS